MYIDNSCSQNIFEFERELSPSYHENSSSSFSLLPSNTRTGNFTNLGLPNPHNLLSTILEPNLFFGLGQESLDDMFNSSPPSPLESISDFIEKENQLQKRLLEEEETISNSKKRQKNNINEDEATPLLCPSPIKTNSTITIGMLLISFIHTDKEKSKYRQETIINYYMIIF